MELRDRLADILEKLIDERVEAKINGKIPNTKETKSSLKDVIDELLQLTEDEYQDY